MPLPEIKVFNFDDPDQWKKVLAVANHPLPRRALEAAMKWRCGESGWDHQKGPWEFSRRDTVNWPRLLKLSPKPDSPNWYRMFGYCGLLAHWSGAVGSLVFPDHAWYYTYNMNIPDYGCHCAGLGLIDGGRRSIIIMDLLFSPQCIREGTEQWLTWTLTNTQTKQVPIVTAIERLESDGCQFAEER